MACMAWNGVAMSTPSPLKRKRFEADDDDLMDYDEENFTASKSHRHQERAAERELRAMTLESRAHSLVIRIGV